MVILDSLQSVLTIFIMIGLGFYLTKKGWFTEETSRLFSNMVTKVSLPAFMVSNLLSNFTKENLSESLVGLMVPLASMIIMYMLSFIIVKLFKINKNEVGTFTTMFSLSNTIFIGLPICISLFGEISVPYVLLYYIVNTLVFWTIGIYCIKKDGGLIKHSLFSLESLKNLSSPPLIAFIISVILIVLNVKLPKSIVDSCKYIGNLTTPLSTLFIGMTLSSFKLEDIKMDISSILIILGRFVVSPLVIMSLAAFAPIPVLMKKVFIIEASLPVMTQVAIVTKAYNGNYKYATLMSTLSTAISLVFIPIYMIIFTYIF